jgi:hypothetical protein
MTRSPSDAIAVQLFQATEAPALSTLPVLDGSDARDGATAMESTAHGMATTEKIAIAAGRAGIGPRSEIPAQLTPGAARGSRFHASSSE